VAVPLQSAPLSAGARYGVRAVTGRWLAVVAYAVCMAYVESAAVLYLRTIYGGVDPIGRRASLFKPVPEFLWIEVGREASTLIMLGAIGWLAGRGLAGRLGAFALAFGIWDIFYYAFLWLFAGWPASLLAPDILFLIPLPWWGPVVTPMLLAAIIVAAGSAAMAREAGDGIPRPQWRAVLAVVIGSGLCLVAFMADALLALGGRAAGGPSYAQGGAFAWPAFTVGVVVGVVGLWGLVTRVQPDLAAAERQT
jgi:hypothetical protein